MSLEQIHAAIPHRAPFLLVDEIVEQSDDRIVCRKTFRGEEYFFAGHYPGFPLVPGVLLCEAGMQAGAILLSRYVRGAEARVPVATRLDEVKFKHMVRPGETILIAVDLIDRLAEVFFLMAKIKSGGKTAARFEFACTLARVG
jgi:3-hydroxyacyl-[acyl-carrier-protein] dehydratase